MKKAMQCMPAKVAAVVISGILALVFAFSCILMLLLGVCGAYDQNRAYQDFYKTDLAGNISHVLSRRLVHSALGLIDMSVNEIAPGSVVIIKNADEKIIFQNGSRPASFLESFSEYVYIYGAYESQVKLDSFKVEIYVVDDENTGSPFHTFSSAYKVLIANKYTVAIAVVLSFGALLGVFVYIMSAAGHRRDEAGIHIGFFSSAPFDIYAAAFAFITFVTAAGYCILFEMFDQMFGHLNDYGYYVMAIVSVLIFTAFYYVCLHLCVTLAVRIKSKTLFSSMITVRVLKFFWKIFLKICAFIKRGWEYFIHGIPSAWRALSVIFILAILNFCAAVNMMSRSLDPIYLFFVFSIDIAAVVLVCRICGEFSRIKKAALGIAGGNIFGKIDSGKMLWDMRITAEALNSIDDGMKKAIDEQMKSERLKAELITNVSHDIKTPLTSIINYVDLLKRENPDNEKIKEYIEILERHSAKLKKLTEDLIEASKASTGNVRMELSDTDAAELLRQCAGEYEERFQSAGLTQVLTLPEESVVIVADGDLLWRVLDNIMSNALKYSQPETRVYINAGKSAGKAFISVKNVSKEQLNISADELTERFVRGDNSRSSEGSGLGLSIARSLTELMYGTLDISIDGDLFKVTLKFPCSEK